ncbi:MAG: SipW-dependent-type signal peptide-containing protein [Clostridia bacterium]
MQKKKIYGCIACIALLVGAVIFQTFAYFTNESTTTNVITTGYVEMELYEEISTDGLSWEFLPIDETTSIMPGDTVGQIAYVENTGSENFYARVSVNVEIIAADGETILDNSVVSLNIDTENWVEDEDGFYRYIGVIEVGDYSGNLFDEVYFSTAMDNSYIGSVITIVVGSQSVQSRYNGYDESIGETVLDVDGFPEVESEVRS